MRVKIEFKDREERFGFYDSRSESLADVASALNSKAFISLTWRKPVSEGVYRNAPVLIASDTIASVTEASSE